LRMSLQVGEAAHVSERKLGLAVHQGHRPVFIQRAPVTC
jgi:hypothetical protein